MLFIVAAPECSTIYGASKDAAEARRKGDKTEEAKAKALKHALKIIANSTSYGCFVELNEQKQKKPTTLDVLFRE
jgi:hypothetical protein